jgi:hypothetical protein
MTTIGRRSRVTQHLGGNAACQWHASEAAGKGMRWAAHRGLDGAPWRGAWPEFHRRAAWRGAEEGDEFRMVTDAVLGRVRNGFHPWRREADVRGPWDTGARLVVTWGRKRHRPASCAELDRGSARCWANVNKMARDLFPIFKFLFLLISQADENNN